MNLKESLVVEAIANYMVVMGTASTTTGNRIISYDDICRHFEITRERLMELKDKIVDELYTKVQICDENGIWMEEDGFNLMFFLGYCAVEED